jgi:hypothetical protein
VSAMAAPAVSVVEQIKLLEDARKLVLSDASYYTQILQGILPIIDPGGRGEPLRSEAAKVELRRWGADFLAETFASPAVPAQQKESLCLIVLEVLKTMIENPNEDSAVVKSVVQTAASIYPLVFRWMYVQPHDANLHCCICLRPYPRYFLHGYSVYREFSTKRRCAFVNQNCQNEQRGTNMFCLLVSTIHTMRQPGSACWR